IFGNGDIDSPQKALEYRNRFGVDGIMIGRASIGYPWIFNEIKHYFKTGEMLPPPSIQQRVEAARKHLTFSIRWKGERTGMLEMRRHYANYFRGLPNFKEYRMKLVQSLDWQEISDTLDEITVKYDGFILEKQIIKVEYAGVD
ncbi:MAG: tRNA-dihydrouridine synthase, partial [Spirosomaceae bacterium]|nr:tRNA-dihydrouridine synthase [Spirosomataceae bacterium]